MRMFKLSSHLHSVHSDVIIVNIENSINSLIANVTDNNIR